MSTNPPYQLIADQLKAGKVVPFFGSATSIAGVRTSRKRLPAGAALAKELMQACGNYPGSARDPLTKVSQFFEDSSGRTPLYEKLKQRFFDSQQSAKPPPVADFIASIDHPLLVITTNYDPHIESAFRRANKSYTLVSHVTNGSHPSAGYLITSRSTSPADHEFQIPKHVVLNPDKETVIYKMHGTFADKLSAKEDSLVITENDYVDFIATSMPSIPACILSHLPARHILFLGYSLEDWNFRVMLRSLRKEADRRLGCSFAWWAIQRDPSEMEQRFWDKRGVQLFDVDLVELIRKVSACL